MRFKDLPVGSSFIIPRDKDTNTYVKINDEPHYNVKGLGKCWNQKFSLHGNTIIKEIN